jgi:2,3-bisphosphoglycerate-independent phosphoglycerate mutase
MKLINKIACLLAVAATALVSASCENDNINPYEYNNNGCKFNEDTPSGRMTAQQTADLLNDLILKSQQVLANAPLNIARRAEGKDEADCIWPWGGGYRPQMKTLQEMYPQIKRGDVISAVDLIRGIGRYAGLHNIIVPGATGLADTNYEGKAQAAIDALRNDDFVFVHVEASDEAGHDGDLQLKLRTIENLDSRMVGRWSGRIALERQQEHTEDAA